jgi:RNA polymerase sigma-70 factor (ECF subfamily)
MVASLARALVDGGVRPAADYDWRATSPMAPHDQARSESSSDRVDTTVDLLMRAQAGDRTAIDALLQKCIPPLRRWAHGRLPAYARDLSETEDLLQETVMHALQRLPLFEYRHQGALQAYLRQAVNNRILDEIRRVHRRPSPVALVDDRADPAASPLEQAIGREGLERYDAALQRLRPADREAIVARLELQQSYEEIAVALGKPSANAARVAVTRALARLVRELDYGSQSVALQHTHRVGR